MQQNQRKDENEKVVKKEQSPRKKGAKKRKRKRGAQPGNKNAVGHGAPYGNQNAVKHGLYSAGFYMIPHTPENIKVYEFMKKNGFEDTIKNFNACKKLLNKIEQAEQKLKS